ncbi:MAG: right-handed parallel beta-helix repeat-containing protein [Myxococcales bacterium]|nr:right-handed parallel beta-helix repeat-containing protein [Myxococcales bacterium]MCB9754813.1 right-handed parallel beta-helix repeat-containing protein [Myxococcales bacterium]
MDRASFTWISSLASLTCFALVACSGGPEGTTETTDSETDPTTDATTEGPDPTTTTVDPSTSSPTTSSTTEPETTTTDPTTGSETTGPPPDCVAADGEVDDACDAATPFCKGGECVACAEFDGQGDAACAGQSADTPVCEQNSATCVECTPDADELCSGATPICDELTYSCDKCTEHTQCGTTACNIEAGICFPEDTVLYVDKNAGDCDNADGSEAMPFCTIQAAFDHAVMQNALGAWTIWIAPGVYTQDTLSTPGMGTKLALLGAGGQVTVQSSNNDQNAANFAIATGDTVYMRDFNLSNHNTYHGFKCESGVAWIDDSRFNDNEQHGVYSIDCTLYMRRSIVYSNKNGGIVIHGTNSMDDPVSRFETVFITENGSAQAAFGGIQVADNHNLDISYSSILVNITNGGFSSMQCVNQGAINIRNSVVVALAGQSFSCDGVVINNSAVDELVDAGMNNIMALASDVDAWFTYQNPGIYNAEAMVNDEPSPLTDLAVWVDGDPRMDFNGDLRPMTDGTPTFAGADIPN